MLRKGMFQPPPPGIELTPKSGPLVVEVAYTQQLAVSALLVPK